MITSFEEYGVSKMTDIINEIYDTGEIPQDHCRLIFIALPKNQEQLNVSYIETSS